MSQAGISTTGVTAIVGDMGVSPIAATAITGFGLIKDPSNRFSTSPIVTGKIYASNYAAPTPAKMTAAVSDMKTAFTTANGLTTPAPIVNIYAGDVSGRTLPTGLYKWSTNLLITNVGVTLNGGANDVWVFQIAQNLIVNNAAIIHLTGGAQAKNVFWVVSGKATLGTDVDFSGNIMSKTSVSLNTNATVNGRILAQTAVTLIANKVAAVGQLSVSPQSGIVYSAVTISGSNFSTTAANNIVKFNGVNAVVKSATSTELVVTVPFGATSGEVTVTANGTTSTSANNFKVLQMVKYGAVAPGAGFNIQSMDGDANGNTYGTATSIDANGIKSSFVFRYADGVVTRIYNAPAGGGSLGSYTLSNLVVNSQGYLNVAQNHKNGTVTTTKILKIAQSGQVTSGSENPGTVFSMFTNPSGNLYVAMESELKKITPAGTVSVVSGFNPKGATHIVADTFGNIYYSNMVLVNN
ncbi:MAG: ice-binding family protein, partial [Mucilaginibacter sp.]